MTTIKQGILRTVTFAYDPASGQQNSSSTQIYNATGVLETHTETSRYGFLDYPALRFQNLLAPVIESKAIVQGEGSPSVPTAVGATTWNTFPREPNGAQPLTVWAAHKTYRWTGGDISSDFDFAAWSGSSEPPSGWFGTSEVSVRTSRGLVTERLDPTGQARVTIFDLQQRFPVATFTSAKLKPGLLLRLPALRGPARLGDRPERHAHRGRQCIRRCSQPATASADNRHAASSQF